MAFKCVTYYKALHILYSLLYFLIQFTFFLYYYYFWNIGFLKVISDLKRIKSNCFLVSSIPEYSAGVNADDSLFSETHSAPDDNNHAIISIAGGFGFVLLSVLYNYER